MAGRKVFTSGEILTAADVNSFLMNQVVAVFADSTARSSAIPTPSEGMVTYVEDNNRVEVYDGSSFGPIGGILQVVQGVKNDSFSTSGTGSVTGLSASITPSSTASKVLVTVALAADYNDAGQDVRSAGFTVFRGATNLSAPAVSGSLQDSFAGIGQTRSTSRLHTVSINFLDSPSTTSSTTYQVKVANSSSSATVFVNRTRAVDLFRGVSTITLMEVAV